MKGFSLIAAQCENRGIGFKGQLPWRLKKEMAYFTEVTSKTENDSKQNAVVMGRNTWDSIPTKFRPLPNRVNVVLSKSLKEKPEECHFLFNDFDECLKALSENESIENIFIIGGEEVYKRSLLSEYCKNIFLTRLFANYECDTFFPEFDEKTFKETKHSIVPEGIQEENGIKYKYFLYTRE